MAAEVTEVTEVTEESEAPQTLITETPPSPQPEKQAATAESAEQQPEGAPEKYNFLAPEGQEFDDAILGAYSEVAKELNMPQAAAQKVLDKMAPAIQARQAEQIAAVRTGWAESAKADKEYGGEKLAENLAVAKKALEAFGSPELRTLLNESGLGDNPEIIRAFYRAGKTISEDSFVGGQSPPSTADDARSLYPNSKFS